MRPACHRRPGSERAIIADGLFSAGLERVEVTGFGMLRLRARGQQQASARPRRVAKDAEILGLEPSLAQYVEDGIV